MDANKVISEKKNEPKLDIDSIIQRGNQPKPITELDRLSYIVNLIEHDCAICPYKTYVSTENSEIKNNTNFRGLSIEEAGSLENYRHFRPTTDTERSNITAVNDSKCTFNYLQSLQDDIPFSCWSIVSENGGCVNYWSQFVK